MQVLAVDYRTSHLVSLVNFSFSPTVYFVSVYSLFLLYALADMSYSFVKKKKERTVKLCTIAEQTVELCIVNKNNVSFTTSKLYIKMFLNL